MLFFESYWDRSDTGGLDRVKHTFSGNFKVYIEGLIEEKQALGFLYERNQAILAAFDRFCLENYPNESVLTRDICMRWSELRPSEHSAALRNRIIPVRELGKYMRRLGIQAFVIPNGLTGKRNRYVPHFFTREELSLFFKATDRLKYSRNRPGRHLVVPVMFRLIYTCGLRPIEARRLMISDVDLATGTIYIRESKGHKDRTVVVSDDMLTLCKIYKEKIDSIFPDSEYFFPNHRRKMYSACLLDRTFKECWNAAEIHLNKTSPPRVYDMRHNFATNCLCNWMKNGKDINAMLPYLSAYLGHVNLSDTAYYIHLVPEFFPQMAKMDLSRFADLIPEVQQ